jgi:hypothetical protein
MNCFGLWRELEVATPRVAFEFLVGLFVSPLLFWYYESKRKFKYDKVR